MTRLLFLSLFLTGCFKVYPGDGTLVIVDIDRDLDTCYVRTSTSSDTLGTIIRHGIRLWDVAGTRLRTEDQLIDDERGENESAPRLRIRGDACSEIEADVVRVGNGIITPSPVGQYDGDVHLFIRRWPLDNQLSLIATVAHEVGHAIGLDHVRGQGIAVMNESAAPLEEIGESDLREHRRVWQ